jgi:hypothetical protein
MLEAAMVHFKPTGDFAMWRAWAVIVVLAATSGEAWAQLDVRQLAEAYRQFDAARNEGRGYSDSPDSSTLGWGESYILQEYLAMWEVTEDVDWLEKARDHFGRVMANASDPDGDGYLSWSTLEYSYALATAERLVNRSDAQLEPASQRNGNGKEIKRCRGHAYLVEMADAASVRIIDWDTRKTVAEGIAYQDGMKLKEIEPFSFTFRGRPEVGDRFLVRTIAPEAIEYVVHQGMLAYPVALWIEAVKSRPELRERFGADTDRFLAFLQKNLLEKNERDWLDLGELGGGYRSEPKITDRIANRLLPHNQYGALARAWLVLSRVEGADPRMGQRGEAMVRLLRHCMEVDDAHNAYRWHYADWTEYGKPRASGYEDTSHAALTLSLAIEAARRGLIFNDDDMRKMANTWLEVLWNHDETNPQMASTVDGKGPHEFPAVMRNWTELAQWNPKVYELALKQFSAMKEAERAPLVPVMLLCAKRAGKLTKDQ